MSVTAKTKWDLEGWRIDHGKWMDGLLFTYFEDDWVQYRLEASRYDGADTTITVRHDYTDADGAFGVDAVGDFFIGAQTNRTTGPDITPILVPDGLFQVTAAVPVDVPNGQELSFSFIVPDWEALVAAVGAADFAFYWKAHLAVTALPAPPGQLGSSYWNGASLHAHTSVTGNQDVPIKTPPVTIPDQPSIDVEKEVKVDCTNWFDADDPPGPVSPVPNPSDIYFMFTVTNTGNVELTNITLSDSDFDLSGLSIPSSLAPGESFQREIGPLDAIVGQHTNTATATGDYDGNTYQDTDDANYFGVPK
jgi:hypothetical protein